MLRLSQAVARRFVAASPEAILATGVAIACLIGILMFSAARYEGVLRIERGVGFSQNLGWFAALIGDAVLLFLARKYFDVVQIDWPELPASLRQVHSRLRSEMHSIANLDDRKRGALLLMAFVGLCFVTANISLQLAGDTEKHWRSDVFDSPLHPTTFALNKTFLVYSWVIIIPYCAYIAVFTSLFISNISDFLEHNEYIKYDLLDPDRAGGFAGLLTPRIYLNLGAAIVYLQITLYSITFKGANLEHLIGYFAVTAILIFGNFLVFQKIDRVIDLKRTQALSAAKNRAYSGESLQLDLFKYYVDRFGKNTLQMKLSRALLAIKAVVILIPPIAKMALFAYP